jgi:hypothetical protein
MCPIISSQPLGVNRGLVLNRFEVPAEDVEHPGLEKAESKGPLAKPVGRLDREQLPAEESLPRPLGGLQ